MVPEGVTAIGFGLRTILDTILHSKGIKVEEISLDIIFGTNNDNLELYAIVLDVEAGVPAFYLILEMKRAICEAAVRTQTLVFFLAEVCQVSQLCPKKSIWIRIGRKSMPPTTVSQMPKCFCACGV